MACMINVMDHVLLSTLRLMYLNVGLPSIVSDGFLIPRMANDLAVSTDMQIASEKHVMKDIRRELRALEAKLQARKKEFDEKLLAHVKKTKMEDIEGWPEMSKAITESSLLRKRLSQMMDLKKTRDARAAELRKAETKKTEQDAILAEVKKYMVADGAKPLNNKEREDFFGLLVHRNRMISIKGAGGLALAAQNGSTTNFDIYKAKIEEENIIVDQNVSEETNKILNKSTAFQEEELKAFFGFGDAGKTKDTDSSDMYVDIVSEDEYDSEDEEEMEHYKGKSQKTSEVLDKILNNNK